MRCLFFIRFQMQERKGHALIYDSFGECIRQIIDYTTIVFTECYGLKRLQSRYFINTETME